MYENLPLDADYTYATYAQPAPTIGTTVIGGNIAITNINGVTGPSITFNGGATGYSFVPAGNSVDFILSDAAVARAALGAAKSGVNTDITELNGASQVDVSARYEVGGTKVVGAQGAAVPDAVGGITIDTEARAALNALLARLRAHGLIA